MRVKTKQWFGTVEVNAVGSVFYTFAFFAKSFENWAILFKMNMALQEALLEFLECSIHSILYVRGIYPASLFEQRLYLGVSVWQARHPEINAYIRRVLDNARPLFAQVHQHTSHRRVQIVILCNSLRTNTAVSDLSPEILTVTLL